MLGSACCSWSLLKKRLSQLHLTDCRVNTESHIRPKGLKLSMHGTWWNVIMWLACILRLPILKMAVWLILPCAGGPNSGRKSDAQGLFREFRMRKAMRATCVHYYTLLSSLQKKKKNYIRIHAIFVRIWNTSDGSGTSFIYSFPVLFCTHHLHTHHEISHHESRREGRRVAALDDRCLYFYFILFFTLQVSSSDSLRTGELM